VVDYLRREDGSFERDIGEGIGEMQTSTESVEMELLSRTFVLLVCAV